LAKSDFRRRFEQKGRLHSYLAAIPSQVVVHPAATFIGLTSLFSSQSDLSIKVDGANADL
jgi:glucokinase